MKKKLLALVCAGTLICGSAFQVSAESATALDIAERVEAITNEVERINTGLEAGAKMEFKDNKIIFNVAGGPQQGVELSLEDNILAAEAAAVNTAAEKVESQKKADLEAAIGKKLLDDVTVSAIDLSNKGSITAVTQIASELARTLKGEGSVKEVQTAVVEISRTSGSGGGVVAFNIDHLGLGLDINKMRSGEQKVYVLYHNGTAVEKFSCDITETGTLYFEMSSFSPVCFVKVLHEVGEEDEDEGQGNASQQTSSKTPVSPKTVDAEAAVVVLIAMMGIAGIIVCRKKIRVF